MAIGKNKRRYTLSLTVSTVNRYKSLAKEFNMPSNAMSMACDDVLRNICGVFEDAKAKGSMGIDDLFRVMGTQMQLLVEEEKNDAVEKSKRDSFTPKKLR